MSLHDNNTKVSLHETSVRAVIKLDATGAVIMSGLPGLEISYDGQAFLDPASCELTFELLRQNRTQLIYFLMEDQEVPEATYTSVNASAHAHGVATKWISIVDFNKPDATFEEQWRGDRARRAEIIQADGAICLSCFYGAGRSGMMAAAVIVETGKTAALAIKQVRDVFDEAISNIAQERWVAGCSYLPKDV